MFKDGNAADMATNMSTNMAINIAINKASYYLSKMAKVGDEKWTYLDFNWGISIY